MRGGFNARGRGRGGMPFMPQPALNRRTAAQIRQEAFINSQQLDDQIEQQQLGPDYDPESAAKFKRVLFFAFILAVLLLMGSKYVDEYNVSVPMIAGGEGGAAASESGIGAANAEEIQKWFEKVGVTDASRVKKAYEGFDPEKETKEAREERMMERWKLRQQLKKNLQEKHDEQNALVTCGKECQDSYKQIQTAYDNIVSQVDEELHETVFGRKIKNSEINSYTDAELREKYEQRKAELLKKTEGDEEKREMHLTLLKEATETLQNTDGRKYYLMYGTKPPEQLKHVRANHGGWGQELALKTFRNRLMMAWLQHFDSTRLDMVVIALVIGVGYLIPMIFTVPKAIDIATAMVEEHERMEAMDEAAKNK